jgi:hypothetical protein
MEARHRMARGAAGEWHCMGKKLMRGHGYEFSKIIKIWKRNETAKSVSNAEQLVRSKRRKVYNCTRQEIYRRSARLKA